MSVVFDCFWWWHHEFSDFAVSQNDMKRKQADNCLSTPTADDDNITAPFTVSNPTDESNSAIDDFDFSPPDWEWTAALSALD